MFDNGYLQSIANEQGNRVTPVRTSFAEALPLVGEKSTRDPNSIGGMRELIGRKFGEESVQQYIREHPEVRVEKGQGDKPVIVTMAGKKLFPEEISAIVISYLKKVAEMFIGTKLTSVVLAVPPYFNDNQRQATKDAISISGLKTLRIIN